MFKGFLPGWLSQDSKTGLNSFISCLSGKPGSHIHVGLFDERNSGILRDTGARCDSDHKQLQDMTLP